MWRVLTASIASNVGPIAFAIAALMCLFCMPNRAFPQPPNKLPPPISADRAPQEIATRLIHMALHQAVWGPPAFCTVRQQITIDQQQISGFGKYIRAGEGSGRLKLSLQFPAGDSMNSLLQVSDGQILHTIVDFGGESSRTIIDLDKVRKRLIINNDSLQDPVIAMYLAIGGQAESIRKLCQQYDWVGVQPGRYAQHDVWLLDGRLAATPPAVRAQADTDILLHVDNSSGLLPTRVRVAIAKPTEGNPLRYWMFQLEGTRQRSEVGRSGRSANVKHLIEWADPTLVTQPMTREAFEATSTDAPFSDESHLYLPPQLNLASLPAGVEQLQETR